MRKIHDLTVNPNDLPCYTVYVIVKEVESGKEWKPKTARYDRKTGFWLDKNDNILNFDGFKVVRWYDF